MTLPIEVWTLTIPKIYKWPLFRAPDQFFTDRILQNVICLFPAAFIMAQPMFKEIALPCHTYFFSRPFLPLADDRLHRFS